MIPRPKISRNEWKPTEIGAFEVGNFAPFSCPGFAHACQFVDVAGGREAAPTPHFYQNLAEAEYVVAVYAVSYTHLTLPTICSV